MTRRKISFDGWVLDRESGDLSRNGTRQRLQELPLKVLDLLLATPGGLVTREQLIAHLWPKGVVDYDTGLNTAVRKLRVALADLADAPRYIETIPRRGYRFIGTVDPEPPAAAEAQAVPATEPTAVPIPAPSASAGDESQTVEETAAVAPAVMLEGPVPETAPVPDRPVDSPPTKPRRRLFLGIGATLAVCVAGVYWLSHRAVTTPVAISSLPGIALPDRSVAVLPFENLSTEPNNEFLALGIAETVLHRLGGVRDLTVIARTSSFVFKNRNEDARQIGRALNAHYLVQGSVQRAGERLRVQAQLIDATSGKQLWSLAFDRSLADIFALQDEISTKVADQLSVSLTPGTLAADEVNTSHVDAYLSYMQGRALIATNKITDAKLALEYFARATQMDPKFAAAFAQQSRAISQLGWLQDRIDPDDLRRAIELNDRALTLDPRLGEAWVQRASLRLDASGDKEVVEAEKAFRKGLALAPNYGQGFEAFANFLWNQNRIDDALIAIERARQVDPLSPRNHYLKALLLDIGGRETPEIESLYLQALKINPTYHPALTRLGQLYNWQGEYARALMLQEKAIRVEPESAWIREATAETYLSIGDVAAAEDVLGAQPKTGGGLKICVLMLKGDHGAAAAKAFEWFGGPHSEEFTMTQLCAASEIVRDALSTQHYDHALRTLELNYAVQPGNLTDWAHSAFIWGAPLARLLYAKGDTARANQLAQSILAINDRDSRFPGYKPLFLLAHASALAVLDERDRALEALEGSMRVGGPMFWLMIDGAPLFDRLKQDERYRTLRANLGQRMRKQVELVATMRAARDLPQRPANRVVTH